MLAAIGIYGLMAYSVQHRTQEIGIRMALGANAAAVLRIVLAGGLVPALAGTALGLFGAFVLKRTLATFLYETSAMDPVIIAAVVFLLIGVTIVACLVPAARAARIDPVAALRNE